MFDGLQLFYILTEKSNNQNRDNITIMSICVNYLCREITFFKYGRKYYNLHRRDEWNKIPSPHFIIHPQEKHNLIVNTNNIYERNTLIPHKALVYKWEKFEGTKGVIRRHTSKTDRQYNGKNEKKRKMTNNDVQNTTSTIKDRPTRTPPIIRSDFRCSGRVSSSFCTFDSRR